jgi:tRNA 2-thiouridine synthesizing protein A
MPEQWNAGDLGCARLVFELQARISQLQPGDTLEITANDPGARTDLPAWSRMTGHELVSAEHPVYMIRRKG